VHSRAIVEFLKWDSIVGDATVNVETLPGRGLRSDAAVLGSIRWMDELGMQVSNDMRIALSAAEKDGNAVVCVATSGSVQGIFVLAEEWRPEVSEAMNSLQLEGIDLTVLSGDPGLRPIPWDGRGGLLPEEKLRYLEGLRAEGKVVAMIGDGINDAPALAASDVGIAMGCGADVARDAAGVCLLDNDLRKIPWTIALARKTVRVMRQNLAWAFVFNLLGVGLACFGKLNPVVAALAMTLSSLLVLANSLRLASGTTAPAAGLAPASPVSPLPEAPPT
jgi:P-type E1-E2 ATPase